MSGLKLPKLYSPVFIEFWTLRNGIGSGMGVVFDIDTKVSRKCMRVRVKNTWAWQIVNYNDLREWDDRAIVDQEILLEYGPDADYLIMEKVTE